MNSQMNNLDIGPVMPKVFRNQSTMTVVWLVLTAKKTSSVEHGSVH